MMFQLFAYSENRYTIYTSAVLKNNTLATVDIIFIDKLQFVSFFHFSDLRNLRNNIEPWKVWFQVIP